MRWYTKEVFRSDPDGQLVPVKIVTKREIEKWSKSLLRTVTTELACEGQLERPKTIDVLEEPQPIVRSSGDRPCVLPPDHSGRLDVIHPTGRIEVVRPDPAPKSPQKRVLDSPNLSESRPEDQVNLRPGQAHDWRPPAPEASEKPGPDYGVLGILIGALLAILQAYLVYSLITLWANKPPATEIPSVPALSMTEDYTPQKVQLPPWNRLSKGMSMGEVAALLGKPHVTQVRSTIILWVYPGGGIVSFDTHTARLQSWNVP